MLSQCSSAASVQSGAWTCSSDARVQPFSAVRSAGEVATTGLRWSSYRRIQKAMPRSNFSLLLSTDGEQCSLLLLQVSWGVRAVRKHSRMIGTHFSFGRPKLLYGCAWQEVLQLDCCYSFLDCCCSLLGRRFSSWLMQQAVQVALRCRSVGPLVQYPNRYCFRCCSHTSPVVHRSTPSQLSPSPTCSSPATTFSLFWLLSMPSPL